MQEVLPILTLAIKRMIIVLLFSFFILFVIRDINSFFADHFRGWKTYTSEQGFSLKYPFGYAINETKIDDDTMLFVVEADVNGNPIENRTPVMQITISRNLISFALWEGQQWMYFPDIVETFQSKTVKVDKM